MSGEYAGYIMTAYILAAVVLGGLTFQSIRAWRRVSAEAEKAGGEDA